uniref:Protein kinase domain-containing protein n=1 Tax=Oryzias latipes TaxID=8090 RepID=A0A3P9LIE1_ORYLA
SSPRTRLHHHEENLEKTEDLQTDKDQAKMSRKGSKKTEAFELMEGHYLVGNQGIYKVQEFLGEGSFGKVAKCTKLGSQEMYAIKIIANVQEGKEEFESMKVIQVLDPDENHLMKMYECFSFQNVICLVYEILEESLEDFLNKNECKATPLTYVRAIAQQMFQALKALKSIGVVHCDIKLDNIMFADEKSLKFKLIDFGVAVEKKELPIGTEIQAIPFRAPEVILGLPLDESVDMWALGMVLACVYSGNYLFPSRTEYETIRAMVQIFGLPEADVLHRAKNKAAFFTRDNGDWRLCTPEEYTKSTGVEVRHMDYVIDFDNLEKTEDLQTDKDQAKMSRKGSRKIEAFELTEGHYLVGNQGIYKVQEFLGEGSFGKVAKCTKLGSQEMYAIKIIANVQEGKEEFESMKVIQVLDPDENHLMKMYECFSFQNVICLVYEILEESLEDFLNKNECKATPLTYVRAIAQQMFQALKALKSIGVVHCDIKLDNIMFADEKSLKFKLIDFGVAVEKKELPIGTEIQAIPFRAPEVILGLPLDESVDMWALGMVLACVYTMVQIFDFDAMTDQHRNMYQMHDDDDHKVNPQRRITPSQALEHDFITMKHLAGKSKAAYAAGCKGVMGKTPPSEGQVNPSTKPGGDPSTTLGGSSTHPKVQNTGSERKRQTRGTFLSFLLECTDALLRYTERWFSSSSRFQTVLFMSLRLTSSC